ncbi:MAG: hydroxypyruvate isomerase family protein [Terriglobia bacterium]
MNRRSFARTLGGAALGTFAVGSSNGLVGASGKGAPFGLSVMLWTVFQKLPFEERLEKVAEAGYRQVELTGEFRQWSETDYRNVDRKKHALGMRFDATSGLKHGITDPADRPAFLSDLRNMLPVLDRLECPALIVLAGNRVPGMPHAIQHQSCIEGLNRGAELIEGKNVRLLVENIDPEENPRYFLTSAAEGFEIIRAVNHPQVRFLYDFYHEQIAEGNLIEKLEKNIDFTGLVHIADVPGRHEPGTGEIDYKNIFKKLGELNYGRNAAMEYKPTYNPVKSLRTARKMALSEGAKGAV